MEGASFNELASKLVKRATQTLKREEVDQIYRIQGSFTSASARSAAALENIKQLFDIDKLAVACQEASSRDGQLARNDARSKLFKFCSDYMKQVQVMLQANNEPQSVLQEAQTETLLKFKAHEEALSKLMSQVQQAHEQAKHAFQTKHDALEHIHDNFDAEFAQLRSVNTALIDIVAKVECQTAKEEGVRQKVVNRQLEQLQSRSETFVKADETPSKNVSFQNVLKEIDNLNSRKRSLDEDALTRDLANIQEQLSRISSKIKGDENEAPPKRQRISLGRFLSSWIS